MNARLKVTNLSHRYGSIEVLAGVDLSLAAGKVFGLFGESGSGKTTLLLACGGMLRPSQGEVLLDDQDLYQLSPTARTRYRSAQIGFLFQTLELVPYLNVKDNVMLAHQSTSSAAVQLLQQLGLEDRATHKPCALSHGQRQRAALARAMAHRPALLIADEPTGNLDEKNSQQVFAAMRSFADNGGAVLVASHDPGIRTMADDCFELEAGKLVP